MILSLWLQCSFFFFNDTATTEIYTSVHTLSLHDALPISLARRADHELRRRAGGGERRRRPRALPLEHEAAGQLQIRQEVAGEVLLARESAHVRGAGRFEVDRDAAGELDRPLDLGGLGAGEKLQVNVAVKALSATKQLDRGEHAVGHLGRSTGDARRQEEPVGQARAVGVHEDSRDFLGTEVGPPHLAAAEGRAIAAGQRASVGLHDAHEPRRAPAWEAHLRDPYRVAGAHQRALWAVPVGRFRENRHAGPEIHGRNYYT